MLSDTFSGVITVLCDTFAITVIVLCDSESVFQDSKYHANLLYSAFFVT